ncbi:L-threonylcarbamoyladenylate synthase type 1 TsaC [Buchnera aphidicola (Hyadaphis tataricae)]|uniref:Threonylcarbamoyl-AMP synthase n=2 Tax=Buchnera aphidicola TaxID=9 RepID=A0A4D6Y6Q1_9GAMM|nr:L-threonylcarbamoyladenylate synthase type 1 TsaC [Buchnera aphidicola (Hyadaphis tataricae)]
MNKHSYLKSLMYCINMLHEKNVIAYPTESMFGLGCDPNSKNAIMKLLYLKKRNIEKGFILVASNFDQIKMYIDEDNLSKEQKKRMFLHWPGPFTFLLPARSGVPKWLTGKFQTIAVRISAHVSIIELCNAFGSALISTSANITNMHPSKTYKELFNYFGQDFPVLHGKIGNEKYPSTIINITNGNLIRHV